MAVVSPAVPGSTVQQANTTGQFVDVALTGFTSTFIFIYDQNGVAHQMGTSGNQSVLLPPGYSISITYSVAGTWVWSDPPYSAEILQFGGYSAENLVLISQLSQLPFPGHVADGQAGLGEAVSN